MIIEFIETTALISLIVKTIWQIKHDHKTPLILFQWFGLIIFQTYTELFESFKFFTVSGIILQIGVIALQEKQLQSCVEWIERFPTEKILTEIRYQCSYALISGTSKIVKVVFIKILQSIETQQLTDERQSKLSQRLLEVSQFIENETQNRCNKSQIIQSNFLDQTLNLNYTVIEKNEDIPSNRENMEILKDLGMSARKEEEKLNQQVDKENVQEKPPQQIKQVAEPKATIVNKQNLPPVANKLQQNSQPTLVNKSQVNPNVGRQSQPVPSKVQTKANQAPVQQFALQPPGPAIVQQPTQYPPAQAVKQLSSASQQIKQSQSPEQIKSLRSSIQLDSMRKTLDLLESDKKKITEQIVIETIQDRIQKSKTEQNQKPFDPQREIYEKLQRCREKIQNQEKFYE